MPLWDAVWVWQPECNVATTRLRIPGVTPAKAGVQVLGVFSGGWKSWIPASVE